MKSSKLIMFFTTILIVISSYAQHSSFAIPPNTTLTLNATAYAFDNLELNEGSLINVAPSVGSVQITINTLVLNGKSTIDLTSPRGVPPTPAPKPGKPQANPDGGNTKNGETGYNGDAGLPGANGVSLTLTVNALTANGSLWIRTDGGRGGNGGNGGNGGQGSSGPHTCVHNADGGNGGTGGSGGAGGTGGNTSIVTVKVGNNTITAAAQQGVAPSNRPLEANIINGIVISGAPGAGGSGGEPGYGGGGGQGYENHFPCTATDSHPGHQAGPGAHGAPGAAGKFSN